MSKIETQRKTPQKVLEVAKKARSRHLLLPLAGVALGGGIWGVWDLESAGNRLSAFPKYTTADGRNNLAEELFTAGKNLKGISSTTETKLGKDATGEPVIIFQRKLSSSNWKKAQQIIAEAAGELKDQPTIVEALKKIDMEIVSGGSTVGQDVFTQQIDEINAVIPQIVGLKDSPQVQKRTIVESEVRKRQDRGSKIFMLGVGAFASFILAHNILGDRAKRRKIEASRVKQSA